MEYNQLRLEQVLSPLLALMYGTGDNVPNNLIRSCLIFACDHGMKKIVKELEEVWKEDFFVFLIYFLI
ncbi:unnamed protein product [Meloidogyne enterolobii]|uniref:Uncharacterized protein n=1 Tax=Meloidogyne enterolobii TaxID=390850 RepID=A0ACB0ZQ12_MELEN